MSTRHIRHVGLVDSVWVSASAGTGKTHVLADRVVQLLMSGASPARILCLTFTKAAAAEMSNRIYRRLGSWASAKDAELQTDLRSVGYTETGIEKLEVARRLFGEVLDTPGGLRIETIHAFCDSLLSRFPLEAGIAPNFKVMDETAASECLDLAISSVLRTTYSDFHSALATALTRLVVQLNIRDFSKIMRALVDSRARIAAMQGYEFEQSIEEIQKVLRIEGGVDDDEIMRSACASQNMDMVGLAFAAKAMASGTPTDRKRALIIRRWIDRPENRLNNFEVYISVFLTKKHGMRRRIASDQVVRNVPRMANILELEAKRLMDVTNCRRANHVSASTIDLLRVGRAVAEEYEATKRRQARLDYNDLVLHTCRLLADSKSASWILFNLDGGLDHILIDEAQDTNPEQWRIISALTEDFFSGEGASETTRTLFSVGDPKQSIYGFQRADPAQFHYWRSYFGDKVQASEKSWSTVDLVSSFRSTVPILKAVDSVFSSEEAQDGLLFGRDWLKHDSNRIGQAGIVELWPLEEPEEKRDLGKWELPITSDATKSTSVNLSIKIANQIKQWIDEKEILHSHNREIQPNDIMILVQWRSQFVEDMARALKNAGIPVAGSDRMVLADQMAIVDLIAFGQFLLLPSDDLNLASLLKSPLIGWSEEQLYSLAQPRGDRSLWQALSDSCEGNDHCFNTYEFLSGWLKRVDLIPPYELYAELLETFGGRKLLVARLGDQANEPINEFLSLAIEYEMEGVPSLQGFLCWLVSSRAEVKRDLDQGHGSVRIMTVHGAKGLQAPIVFLPDTTRMPSTNNPLLWVTDDGPVLWPGGSQNEESVCRNARKSSDKKDIQEYRRLLYVAMTRAEDRLYVCGWRTHHQPHQNCWYRMISRGLLEVGTLQKNSLGHRVVRVEVPQQCSSDREGVLSGPVSIKPELPKWLESMPTDESGASVRLSPSRLFDEQQAVCSPLQNEHSRESRFRHGDLVHKLMELLPGLPSECREEAAFQVLSHSSLGLDTRMRDTIAEDVLQLLCHPDFSAVFGPNSRAEVPLIGRIGPKIVSGRVDRLVVGPDEVLVIDYKVNRIPPDHEDDIPIKYLRQMAAYRDLLVKIYPSRLVRCALLWTEGPKMMMITSNILDTHSIQFHGET